jgi:branched-chain amino acid transport system substrate-binding protein
MKKLSFLIILLPLLMLTGCANNKESGNTIKIGVIAELTGSIPSVGNSCKNSAELMTKQINDQGGIEIKGKKYKIELSIEDSGAKPDQAAAIAQKLITQDNVNLIIGPNCSSNAMPASEIAEDNATVLITPWSTNPKTTIDAKLGTPKKYIFRACFTDIFEGKVLAKFAAENLKAKKAAVLYDIASDVLKSQAELFKTSFEELGGKISAFETYTTGDKDFSAQFTKIKSTSPDIIFLPSYYTEVPLQVAQAHRLGIRIPFLGSDAWSTEELIKMCGDEVEGFFLCNHYSPNSKNPITEQFVSLYQKTYRQIPDDVAALTYDAFGLAVQALKDGQSLDKNIIRDSISKITSFEGVTGKIGFDGKTGDPIKGAVILQIKNSKFNWYADEKP